MQVEFRLRPGSLRLLAYLSLIGLSNSLIEITLKFLQNNTDYFYSNLSNQWVRQIFIHQTS